MSEASNIPISVKTFQIDKYSSKLATVEPSLASNLHASQSMYSRLNKVCVFHTRMLHNTLENVKVYNMMIIL